MDFNEDLDKIEMEVKVVEFENEAAEKVVSLIVEDLDSAKVNLSSSSVDEVKELL